MLIRKIFPAAVVVVSSLLATQCSKKSKKPIEVDPVASVVPTEKPTSIVPTENPASLVGVWENCEKFGLDDLDFGGAYPIQSVLVSFEFSNDGTASLNVSYKEDLACKAELTQKTIDAYKSQVLSDCIARNTNGLSDCQSIASQVTESVAKFLTPITMPNTYKATALDSNGVGKLDITGPEDSEHPEIVSTFYTSYMIKDNSLSYAGPCDQDQIAAKTCSVIKEGETEADRVDSFEVVTIFTRR